MAEVSKPVGMISVGGTRTYVVGSLAQPFEPRANAIEVQKLTPNLMPETERVGPIPKNPFL